MGSAMTAMMNRGTTSEGGTVMKVELKRPKKNNELAERFLRAMINTGFTPKGGAKAFLRRLKEVK